jgi:hypothetical protein
MQESRGWNVSDYLFLLLFLVYRGTLVRRYVQKKCLKPTTVGPYAGVEAKPLSIARNAGNLALNSS